MIYTFLLGWAFLWLTARVVQALDSSEFTRGMLSVVLFFIPSALFFGRLVQGLIKGG